MTLRSCSIAMTASLLLLAAVPAQALYKVVGPDGRVTYTDRPPVTGQGHVSALTSSGAPAADAALPPELKQVVARWPVTLYTAPDCAPCQEGRLLLRTRGVPHTEKTVLSDEDREAWQRTVGSADAPALTIGAQLLRGLQAERWHEYLNAAGYPRNSKLPPTYQFAPPLPLVQRDPQDTRAAPPTRPPAAEPSAGEPSAPPGFRF